MEPDQNYLYELTQIMEKLDKIISLLESRNSQNEPKKSEMDICNMEVIITDKENKGFEEVFCCWFKCPNCGDGYIKECSNFCPNCGCEIKWDLVGIPH